MESVIIASPRSLDFVKRLGPEVVTSTNKGGTLVVESAGVRVYITEAMDIQDEYDAEDLARILSVIPTPRFYAVDFNDIGLCKRVLLAVADDAAVVVDNDHGVILSGDHFAERLRAAMDWDWRKE